MNYAQLASEEAIQKTVTNLQRRGMQAMVVPDGTAARETVLSLIPTGTEVMTMTSVTLETTGIAKELNESGKWRSVKQALMAMQRETDGRTMQVMGSAPEYAVGSVHAVTEMGDLVIASNTGSQLPAYAYGADHVIFVVGAQKIVPTFEMAMERLDSYVLPLESDRAHRAYGVEKSNVSKLLVIHNEVRPERIHVVIVRESLGF
jgi:hypothetical protein